MTTSARTSGWAAGAVLALMMAVTLVGTSAVRPAAATTKRQAPATTSATSSASTSGARGWITTGDGSQRLAALSPADLSAASRSGAVRIAVDRSFRGQPVEGFGAALTDASAGLLAGLPAEARQRAMIDLFDPLLGAGISLVRLPLGASDFSTSQYTYDDLPPGQVDPRLAHFSLGPAAEVQARVLGEALRVAPALRVVASPWSAPAWMKTSGSLIGGTLRPEYESAYSDYLVRSAVAWRGLGVPVRWLTVQNEPGYAAVDYPGMLMPVEQEARLAVSVRGALDAAGLGDVELIGYDHNWDDPARPTALLADPVVAHAVSGIGWHCYAGDVSAQTPVRDAHPDEAMWITECSGGNWAPDFRTNLAWSSRNLVVGGLRNWARGVLFWNLALDPAGGPHTGGCISCRGVLTIDPAAGSVTRNVEYDILAMTGRVARPGAVRIGSSTDGSGVITVAWRNPDGTTALYAFNGGSATRTVEVTDGRTTLRPRVPAGAAFSLMW